MRPRVGCTVGSEKQGRRNETKECTKGSASLKFWNAAASAAVFTASGGTEGLEDARCRCTEASTLRQQLGEAEEKKIICENSIATET